MAVSSEAGEERRDGVREEFSYRDALTFKDICKQFSESFRGEDFKSVFVEMLRICKMADAKADKIEESFEVFQESIFIAAVFEV